MDPIEQDSLEVHMTCDITDDDDVSLKTVYKKETNYSSSKKFLVYDFYDILYIYCILKCIVDF